MLAEMTVEQLVEWYAAYEVIPLDDGWRQTDTIAGAIHDNFTSLMAAKAGKKHIPKGWLHKIGSYIPRLKFKKKESVVVDQGSIDNFEAVMRARYGGNP